MLHVKVMIHPSLTALLTCCTWRWPLPGSCANLSCWVMSPSGLLAFLLAALFSLSCWVPSFAYLCWFAQLVDMFYWLVDASFKAALLLCLWGRCSLLGLYPYMFSSTMHPSHIVLIFIALFGGPFWAAILTCKTRWCSHLGFWANLPNSWFIHPSSLMC